MASNDVERETVVGGPVRLDLPPQDQSLLGRVDVQYGPEPHQWMTGEAAEAVLKLLFERHRILFAILLARYQTGLELRSPAGKRATDAG